MIERPLKLIDLQGWLINNREKYQDLNAQHFPPLNDNFYWIYNKFR